MDSIDIMSSALANDPSGRTDWLVVSGSIGASEATGIPLSEALAMQLSKVSPTIALRARLFTGKQARCQQD